MAKDAFYFSHDSNARSDPKLMALINTYGMEGYGRWWVVIEMLREQEDYRLCKKEWVFSALAGAMAFSTSEAKDLINALVSDYELLEEDENYFWSNSLMRRMQKREEVKQKRSEAGKAGALSKWGKEDEDKGEYTRKRSQRLAEAREKGRHTKQEWEEMVELLNFKCVICGCEIEGDTPIKDHIIPIYQGGSDAITNIQPACRSCNSKKGSDKTDHRPAFCQSNGLQMPSKWLAMDSKERKVKEIKKKEKESKVKLAEYVSMTPDEYEKLVSTYGQKDTQKLVDILDNYKGSSGKTYKSDYRAVLSWVTKRLEGEKGTTEPKQWEVLRKMQEKYAEVDDERETDY